jgi:hypothetical protein
MTVTTVRLATKAVGKTPVARKAVAVTAAEVAKTAVLAAVTQRT